MTAGTFPAFRLEAGNSKIPIQNSESPTRQIADALFANEGNSLMNKSLDLDLASCHRLARGLQANLVSSLNMRLSWRLSEHSSQ